MGGGEQQHRFLCIVFHSPHNSYHIEILHIPYFLPQNFKATSMWTFNSASCHKLQEGWTSR